MTTGDPIVSENAFNKIARLENRPSLQNLEPNLFPHGPAIKEVIEVYGDCGVGKTLLMKELARKCILPKNYCHIPLNGLEVGVVYLNNDLQFNIRTFKNFLIQYLNDIVSEALPNKEQVVKIITENSLKRLTILNIYSSDRMYVAFHILKVLLLTNTDISLIIIDSICANYWQDRMSDGIIKMDEYVQHILSRLQRCLGSFNVAVIFTRPLYFKSRTTVTLDVSPVYNLYQINRSIQLVRLNRDNEVSYHITVTTPEACYVKFYSIGQLGFIKSLD